MTFYYYCFLVVLPLRLEWKARSGRKKFLLLLMLLSEEQEAEVNGELQSANCCSRGLNALKI